PPGLYPLLLHDALPIFDPDADDIESTGSDAVGETGGPLPLGGVGGVDGVVATPCRPHLDGDAGAPVPGQDVDLAAPHPYVGGEDTDAVGGEKPAGERLAETPQLGAVQIASSESSSLSM